MVNLELVLENVNGKSLVGQTFTHRIAWGSDTKSAERRSSLTEFASLPREFDRLKVYAVNKNDKRGQLLATATPPPHWYAYDKRGQWSISGKSFEDFSRDKTQTRKGKKTDNYLDGRVDLEQTVYAIVCAVYPDQFKASARAGSVNDDTRDLINALNDGKRSVEEIARLSKKTVATVEKVLSES